MIVVEMQDGRVFEYVKASRFERNSGQTILYEDTIRNKKRKGIRYKNNKPFVYWESYEERKTRVVARFQSGLCRIEYKGSSRQVKGPTPPPPIIVKK